MTRRALFRESTTGAIDDGAGGSIPTVPDPSGEPDGKVLETSSGALVYGTGGTGGDVAGDTHAATSKTTPVDNDEIPLADSATSYSLKKLLWSNLKATLKTYTDTLYDATGAAAAAQAASQPLDSDLTAIAGLDASTSGAIASDGAGWIKKTYSQFKTALSLVKADVGLSNVDNTADSAKSVATAAALTTARNIDGQSFDGSGNITVIAPGTHAATSKATPVDADELSLVDSAASYVLKKLTWANLKATIKAYTDTLYPSGSGTSTGTNTGDQTSVSGNAGTATKLAATKNIDGQAFDGSADITVIAPGTHAATSKATPVDADELSLVDSAASNVLKKLTWANLKATLKTYFDTLYTAAGASAPPNGSAGGDLTGTYPNPTLAAAGGGAAGPTGSATVIPIVTVDAKGRVTALSSATAAPTNAAGGSLSGNYPNPTLAAGKTQNFLPASVIANCLAESLPRWMINNNTGLLSSGRLSGIAIPVLGGTACTSMSFLSATTPANGPTHWWFALVDQATLNVIRQSTDQLTAAWAASTPKTLALDSIPVTAGARVASSTVTLTIPTLFEALTSLVAVGDSIVVSNANIAAYNGTFTVASVSSTQITYVSGGSATDSLAAPFPTVRLASGKRVYTPAADSMLLAVMMMTATSAVISNACGAGLSTAVDALNGQYAASGNTGLTGTCPSPITFGTGTGGVHPWAAIS